MSINVSVQVLDEFSNRLRINTALNVIINVPTIYLIICRSSTAMGFYKYYLLYSVVTTFIMDLHQSVFYGVYFLLPSMASCCSSYCRYLGMIWGPQVNYLILNLNMSIVGFGLVSLAAYRYFSLTGELKFFEKKYSLLILFLLGITYPIPTIIALVVASFNQSREDIESLIGRQNPEFLTLVNMGICSSFKTLTLGYLYIGISGIQIGIVECLGFVLALKTMNLLKSLRGSLSKSTYDLQRQFLISMVLQLLIPIFTLIIPTMVIMSLALLNIKNSACESINEMK